LRIVLCYPVERRHVERIAREVPDAEIVDAGQEQIAREILDADIFCGHAKVPLPWEEVVRHRRLRWIQSSAAGVDHCLVPAVVDSEICVTSASGVLADQVAEHTVALTTALLRSLPQFFRAQQERRFERLPTRDLHGSTVGLVGFGGVGRRLAEILAVFRTRLLATDWFPVDKPPYVESLWPPERLDQLLPQSQVVILCAALTEKTRGMINSSTLSKMTRGSILVNVARGQLVVESDLVEAMESGHLAGAALDVTPEEPLPASSRLWDLPGVVITPHVGGQSAWRIDRMTEFFCTNLRRMVRGERLLNVVDKRLGFPRREVVHSDLDLSARRGLS
jgi:D-3-phosphoglycerate dehydrogenase